MDIGFSQNAEDKYMACGRSVLILILMDIGFSLSEVRLQKLTSVLS